MSSLFYSSFSTAPKGQKLSTLQLNFKKAKNMNYITSASNPPQISGSILKKPQKHMLDFLCNKDPEKVYHSVEGRTMFSNQDQKENFQKNVPSQQKHMESVDTSSKIQTKPRLISAMKSSLVNSKVGYAESDNHRQQRVDFSKSVAGNHQNILSNKCPSFSRAETLSLRETGKGIKKEFQQHPNLPESNPFAAQKQFDMMNGQSKYTPKASDRVPLREKLASQNHAKFIHSANQRGLSSEQKSVKNVDLIKSRRQDSLKNQSESSMQAEDSASRKNCGESSRKVLGLYSSHFKQNSMAEEKAKITRAYVEHSLGNRNIAGVHPLIDNYLLAGGCSFKTYQSQGQTNYQTEQAREKPSQLDHVFKTQKVHETIDHTSIKDYIQKRISKPRKSDYLSILSQQHDKNLQKIANEKNTELESGLGGVKSASRSKRVSNSRQSIKESKRSISKHRDRSNEARSFEKQLPTKTSLFSGSQQYSVPKRVAISSATKFPNKTLKSDKNLKSIASKRESNQSIPSKINKMVKQSKNDQKKHMIGLQSLQSFKTLKDQHLGSLRNKVGQSESKFHNIRKAEVAEISKIASGLSKEIPNEIKNLTGENRQILHQLVSRMNTHHSDASNSMNKPDVVKKQSFSHKDTQIGTQNFGKFKEGVLENLRHKFEQDSLEQTLFSQNQGPILEDIFQDLYSHRDELPVQDLTYEGAYQNQSYMDPNDGQYFSHQDTQLEYLEAEPDDTLMGYDRVTVKDFIQNEEFYTPDPYYFELIEPKSGINWSMRAQLLDWVAEMSSDYGLKYSTFHMSANFIDRFLIADNSSTVNKKNFQLVGLTAVNIATKIEEVYVPKMKDFLMSTMRLYTEAQMAEMELRMVKALKWKLNPPTMHM